MNVFSKVKEISALMLNVMRMKAGVSNYVPRDIFAKLNPHVRSTLRYTTILYQMSWLTSRDQITFDLKGAKWFMGI